MMYYISASVSGHKENIEADKNWLILSQQSNIYKYNETLKQKHRIIQFLTKKSCRKKIIGFN